MGKGALLQRKRLLGRWFGPGSQEMYGFPLARWVRISILPRWNRSPNDWLIEWMIIVQQSRKERAQARSQQLGHHIKQFFIFRNAIMSQWLELNLIARRREGTLILFQRACASLYFLYTGVYICTIIRSLTLQGHAINSWYATIISLMYRQAGRDAPITCWYTFSPKKTPSLVVLAF